MIDSRSDISPILLYRVLHDVIQSVAAADRADDVAAARKNWQERRGRLFEDEHLWEAWTTGFLEWYALEWSGPRGAPLAADLLAREADPTRADALGAWLRSMRTLVEVLAIKDGQVEVCDLLGGAQLSVTEKRTLAGVNRGDVAEVRVVGLDDVVRFGRTFVFHPTGTRDAIAARVAELRGAGRPRDAILDHVARLRLRCDRYPHVPPRRIYTAADDRVPEPDRG
jgi:hypothetical protein